MNRKIFHNFIIFSKVRKIHNLYNPKSSDKPHTSATAANNLQLFWQNYWRSDLSSPEDYSRIFFPLQLSVKVLLLRKNKTSDFRPPKVYLRKNIQESYLFSWYLLYLIIRDTFTKFKDKTVWAKHSGMLCWNVKSVFDVRKILHNSTCLICIISFVSSKTLFMVTYKCIRVVKFNLLLQFFA